jgi:hypothetical protein
MNLYKNAVLQFLGCSMRNAASRRKEPSTQLVFTQGEWGVQTVLNRLLNADVLRGDISQELHIRIFFRYFFCGTGCAKTILKNGVLWKHRVSKLERGHTKETGNRNAQPQFPRIVISLSWTYVAEWSNANWGIGNAVQCATYVQLRLITVPENCGCVLVASFLGVPSPLEAYPS